MILFSFLYLAKFQTPQIYPVTVYLAFCRKARRKLHFLQNKVHFGESFNFFKTAHRKAMYFSCFAKISARRRNAINRPQGGSWRVVKVPKESNLRRRKDARSRLASPSGRGGPACAGSERVSAAYTLSVSPGGLPALPKGEPRFMQKKASAVAEAFGLIFSGFPCRRECPLP